MSLIRKVFQRIDRILKHDPNVNAHCAKFEVDNWILSDFILGDLVPVVGTRPFPIHEQLLMTAAVCRLRPTHIFEWGTHVGKSARIFYQTAKEFNIRVEIHSIDLPDDVEHQEHPKSKRGMMVRNLKEVHLHQGDGLTVALNLLRGIPDDVRPLFFLDGDHSYETVYRELNEIMKSVPHASILIHDTFYQSSESNYNVGPFKAIRDTLAQTSNSYEQLSMNTGLPGMTLLFQRG